ncbi:MAG: helix-turn-helix transcriptional regulator [Rhodospirillales bacterium]|jgi:transcriptional regulator with XRE-family HTH domain
MNYGAMTNRTRYDQFCSLLIAARRGNKMTQVEVADRLGKPQSFVSKYESGERRLDVVEFTDVCAALGISPLDLIQLLLGNHDHET